MTASGSDQHAGDTSPDDRWAERLRPMLDEQLAALGELDALSQRQRELIDGDSTDRLLGLLAERQRLVNKIDGVSERLGPVMPRFEAILASMDEEEASAIRRQAAAVQRLAETVLLRDQTDGEELGRRRDAIADRLAGIGKAASATKAYGGVPARGAMFQDRKA